jgi:hypothetical protein
MTTVAEVLKTVKRRGVELLVAGGLLRFRAPVGVVDVKLKADLARHRSGILERIRKDRRAHVARVVGDAAARIEAIEFTPFELLAVRDLPKELEVQVDTEGQAYIQGMTATDEGLRAAVAEWEGAIVKCKEGR